MLSALISAPLPPVASPPSTERRAARGVIRIARWKEGTRLRLLFVFTTRQQKLAAGHPERARNEHLSSSYRYRGAVPIPVERKTKSDYRHGGRKESDLDDTVCYRQYLFVSLRALSFLPCAYWSVSVILIWPELSFPVLSTMQLICRSYLFRGNSF